MALPPYLTTMVLPWNLRIYGRASARISAFSAGAMAATVVAAGPGLSAFMGDIRENQQV
jgi:hypothetical protein